VLMLALSTVSNITTRYPLSVCDATAVSTRVQADGLRPRQSDETIRRGYRTMVPRDYLELRR